MKVVVCVKQVPVRDSALHINAEGSWLDDSDFSYEMNEPDAYALEEALQLKEKTGGEVVVACAGPDRVLSTIREALAKGAERGLHVQLSEDARPDAFSAAQVLAEAIRPESADLILTGLQSDDLGYGQTGVILAELLGYAHATIIMEVEPEPNGLRVKRELEDGWFQYVRLPLPAVLTIQSGIKRLRYATLMGIKKAKAKEVKTIAGVATPLIRTERVYLPQRAKQSEIFSGDAKTVAHQLVEKLKFEARVI